jgi:hypothetical protein
MVVSISVNLLEMTKIIVANTNPQITQIAAFSGADGKVIPND